MAEQENLLTIERFWRTFETLDFEEAAKFLHREYVAEWPQSGERIRGSENFVAVNKLYPFHWQVSIVRLFAGGNQVVSEVRLEHADELVFAVSIFTFEDGKIIREIDYWPEPYDPPAWRARWVEVD
jgi:limonene-1,2-epoxide hydrolase